MSDSPDKPLASDQDTSSPRWAVPTGLVIAVFVASLVFAGNYIRYSLHGNFDIIYLIFSLFFTVNLLICYWEICLFIHRDSLATRTHYWRERTSRSKRDPPVEFLVMKVPLRRIVSTTLWADVWAAYSCYDDSYAEQKTFGFSADVANGFTTLIPTAALYVLYTVELLPAVVVGIVGTMIFWQWFYVTSVYWMSFFFVGRHSRLSKRELFLYVIALNKFWVACALLGLYVSIRLILDGNYSVLGY